MLQSVVLLFLNNVQKNTHYHRIGTQVWKFSSSNPNALTLPTERVTSPTASKTNKQTNKKNSWHSIYVNGLQVSLVCSNTGRCDRLSFRPVLYSNVPNQWFSESMLSILNWFHENFHFNRSDRWVQLDMVMPTFEVLVGTGKKNAYHSTTNVRVSDTKLSVDDDGLGIVKTSCTFRECYHHLC